jgi:hypothetical protein
MDEKENTLLRIKREVLAAFDFPRVADTMLALGWTWPIDASEKIPTVGDLMKKADEMLDFVLRSNAAKMQSGGLEVEVDNSEIELRFVLASSSHDDFDDAMTMELLGGRE